MAQQSVVGINPLGYEGTRALNPPDLIRAQRAPVTTDIGYQIGTLWVNEVGNDAYMLTDVTANVATWNLLGTDTGALNTLTADSGGAISPAAGNINILGTASQITTTGAGSSITASLPAAMIVPGSLTTTTSLAVGTSATVGTTLGVTGATTLAALTQVGTANINATGAATTTIATGGTGALALGNATGNTALTGSFSTLTDAATFAVGTAGQTGTTTIVSSTAANSVLVQNGVNVGAQITSINNGATAANSTVNILSGVGTAGAGTLSMANNTRVTTIDLGNVAPAAARTTTVLGGNSAQNDTLNILNGAPSANTQTISILSGTATGGTQVLNLGNGIGGGLTINMGNGINSTAQTVNIAGGAAAANSTVNVLSGNATAGTQTLNLATGTGGKTVHVADGAGVATVTIGSTNTTSTLTLQSGSGDINHAGGNVKINTAGKQLQVKGGAVTDFIGQAVLVNGTVTVANTNIAATDRIFVTRSAKNGSTAYGTFVTGITAATSFTITSAKSDTTTETNDASTVDYFIVRQI